MSGYLQGGVGNKDSYSIPTSGKKAVCHTKDGKIFCIKSVWDAAH